MAQQGKKRIGTWVILGLLFVGLIGFGSTGLSGRLTSIGTVGDKEITVLQYRDAIQSEIAVQSAQLGQRIPTELAFQVGLDVQARARLVATRALDNEASQIGLSVGDDIVAEELLAMSEFRAGASFNREVYTATLERRGQTEAQFEEQLREDVARAILQTAVVGAVPALTTYADTQSAWIGEERDIRYVLLTADDLLMPVPEPETSELEAYHAANPEAFTAPEQRRISYAWLTPAMLQDTVEVDPASLEELYQDRIAEFDRPERRIVDRVVMPDETAAEAAAAQLAVDALTFDALVAERGLTMADVALDDVTEADLGAAGAEVFAAEMGAVIGPLPSEFGPAFYRVNAVLDAVQISFDAALPELREELAAQAARRSIDFAREGMADLVAGGAGVADLAATTDMEAGDILWSAEVSDGIAAYAAFREAASRAQPGDFAEVLDLDDGGLFAIEVTEVIPPALRPLSEVQDAVRAAWTAEQVARLLEQEAERLASRLLAEGDFTDELPEPVVATGLGRRSFLPEAPSGLIDEVFGLAAAGELAMAAEDGTVVLARLDAIRAPDPEDADLAARSDILAEQARADLAQELMLAFMIRIQEQTDIRLDQTAINTVHSSF